tara:strand:- start:484 stop:732 length:249 start_codon:yes stop_codon:yes gene_type:complete
MTIDDIKKRLKEKFDKDMIEVRDMTAQSNHFNILVISNQFNNLSLIKRHQIIYSLFQRELTNEIHALQINTYTNSEWKEKNI